MDNKKERGRAISVSRKVERVTETTWIVDSATRSRVQYHVDLMKQTCNCEDFESMQGPCKHIWAVKLFLVPDQHTAPIAKKTTYSQNWSAYNAAQIHEQDHFEILLKDLCSRVGQPLQERGRPRLLLSDVVYASVRKVYSLKSGRRASSDIRSCSRQGHIDHAPHHNSISRYLMMPEVTPLLMLMVKQSALPLKALETQFAIDATGFSTTTYDRWLDHKYGSQSKKQKRQRWLKCHAVVGTKTNIITSVEITDSNVPDVVKLPDLVRDTVSNFNVKEMSADKGYLSVSNVDVIASHGTAPLIPFKARSINRSSAAWQKMWELFHSKREEFLSAYHRRSNVETTFHMIKSKFGGSVRSKKRTSQVNEVLCKVLAHNLVVLIHEALELGVDVQAFLNA